ICVVVGLSTIQLASAIADILAGAKHTRSEFCTRVDGGNWLRCGWNCLSGEYVDLSPPLERKVSSPNPVSRDAFSDSCACSLIPESCGWFMERSGAEPK